MSELQISPDLALPLDAVTGTYGILATKGAGKSNAAVVMAEEMYDAGVPWVAVDPKGDWWGIRSSGDGKGPGLPIVVFGGRRGDVPLEPTAGHLIADLVLAQRLTCVLDVSQFTKADTIRFLTAFGDRLFRHADDDGAEPLHLFLEEAHEYLPQQVPGPLAQMVSVWQRIVKQGRFKGLGCTLVSQRSSSLNKDVLELVDTLIVLRTIGPRSRDAVKAWVKDQDVDEKLLASLPSLASGEAWVWSPGELQIMQRIRFRRRRTFDSGATPKVGQARRVPATLADVDLAAIKEQMADTIEKAKADDPAELRKQIKQLQRELGDRPAVEPERVVEVQVERVEVPVLDEELVIRLEEALSPATGLLAEVQERLAWQVTQHGEVLEYERKLADRTPPRTSERTKPAATSPKPQVTAARRMDTLSVNTEGVNGPRQRILDAIAWYNSVGVDTPRRGHVAFVAGTSPASSGFEKNLGALRGAGLVHYPEPGTVALTPDGDEVARPTVQISTTAELIDALGSRLGKPKATILRVLVDEYPEALDRSELAERVDVSPQSSGFEKNIGSLRGLGFVTYPAPGLVVATDLLFIDGDR